MVVKGTCPVRSCIKQLRIYDARHQPSLSFPGSTNVGHEPSQGGLTLDDHAGTSALSLERLYMRKQASHDVLESIDIIQARGLSSSHRSLSDYFKGETPWVLLDFPDHVFPALKSAFLYASPQS